ncbi:MAG: Rrf2 family transcriptional regulator [Pirellulales bacterium]|nr:Rrf2 family transcriptional regulator [Pirellulales bacterium]
MISQASSYAASALGYIAGRKGEPVLVKAVARECSIPGAYLAKIINVLARKNLVSTQRGVGGGVVLARPARSITLYELCVALDDEVLQPRCMLGNAVCSGNRACPAHAFCRTSRSQLTRFLKKTTIADLAAFEVHRRRKRSSARRDDPEAE